MKIINNLPINDLTLIQLVNRLGIKSKSIEFKLSNTLVNIDGIDCLGSCLDAGNKFIITVCDNELHGKRDGNLFHTLVHELYHVYQFENSLELNCDDADKIAIQLLDGLT